jgi:phenylpropionate dioxygenase-like ring-hydroxylating dioxygenase large terminal subunit
MERPVNLDELVQRDRVHRSIYVDPEIFADEMVKIFGGTWVYVAHESEIPNRNDFKTTRLGLRPVIVTRDDDGEIHLLFNRCSHRAATVCQQEAGNAKRFQCSYHGWTYSNTGALVGLPYPKGYGTDFDRSTRGLRAAPRVASYRGFLFATLNLDAPELEEWLGPAGPILDGFVDRAPAGRIVVRNRHRMTYRGNWKLAWDNAGDGLHPTYAHRSFVILNEERYGGAKSLSQFKHDPDETGMYGQDLGHGHIFVDQRPGMSRSFWATQRPIPSREPYEQELVERLGADEAARALEAAPGSMINLSIFPNLLILGNQLQIVEPVAPAMTQLSVWVCAAEGVPEEVNVLRMRIAEDFPSIGNSDDVEIYERCQEGLAIPEIEWIDTSKGLAEETVDERGVRHAPVTYETPIRGYLEEWKRLMASDPKLVVV